MSLILLDKSDITVGLPLSWPIYGQNSKVLLAQGSMVCDSAQLDGLLALGAYRELSWEVYKEGSAPVFMADQSKTESSKAANSKFEQSNYTFDDMKLNVESRLQLEPAAQLSREHYFVKVIGYLRGTSLLVTTPTNAKGEKPELKEGLKVLMRSFSGQNAFGFSCILKRIVKSPFDYLHLSFPDTIQGIMIRKAIRIKTRIIAAVQNAHSAGQPLAALISNISADGAALDAKHALGKKDEILNLSFRINPHKIDAYLSVKGAIRAVLSEATDERSELSIYRYGIEFIDLQPNDMVILQSMIYQKMVESPHQLM